MSWNILVNLILDSFIGLFLLLSDCILLLFNVVVVELIVYCNL